MKLLRTLLACTLSWAFAVSAADQKGTLETIRSTGTITLGYINDAAPFSSIDAKGEPQGYSVDLCREIARGIGAQLGLPKIEMRWVALTIQNRLEAVRARRVDIECSTTTWTFSRQRDVDFSLIAFVDGGSVLTRVGAGLGRIADLDGKRLAVIKGTTTEQALRDALKRYSVNAQVLTVSTRPEGLKLVEEQKVDGFAADRTTLVGLVVAKQARGAYRLLDEDFSIEP